MAYSFSNVIHPAGADNMGGMATDVYFAPQTAFKSFPTFKKEDDIYLEGKFEFLESDAAFVHITATYKTNGLKSNAVGDTDCRCSKQEGEFFHPGASEAAAKFARLVQNTPGVFIVRDTEGKWRVIGDVVNPANVSVEHDTGKSPEDRKGFTIKFEAYSTRPIVYYKPTDEKNPFPVVGGTKPSGGGTGIGG